MPLSNLKIKVKVGKNVIIYFVTIVSLEKILVTVTILMKSEIYKLIS